VFIPLLSLPGILGQFLIFIPITVITVLTVALILSLTVLPAYVSVLIPDPHQARRKKSRFPRWNRFGDAFRHWFDDRVDRVTESYRSKLEWLLTKRFRRLTAFAVTILLFILSFRIPLPFELFPSGDSPMMSVSLRMPQGTVTEKTQQPTALVENILLRQPEVSRVRSVVSGSAGDLTIELLTNKDRERKGLMTSKELENKWEPLFDSIARRYGATVRIGTASMGPPSEAPVAFRVIAEDRNRLPEAEAVTNELTDLIKTIPGTSGVTNNIEKIPGEFRFRVNRERAVALGVIPEQIPGLTRTALKGQTAATIARDGRDIDITVEFDDSGFTTIEELKRLKIYTPAGVGIELGQVIDIEQEDALSAINRQDGDLAFTVSSLVGDGGNAQAITLAAQEKIAALDLPAGVAVADAGENQENAGLIFGLLSGLVIAVLLMFLIIVTQFNAFFQPLLILFTILFAQIGVAVGLYLTDTPRSLPYLIGVISLAGIVVNHAIILVDQINNLRDRRRESGEADIVVPAAVEGGASRILPVVLTTLTTTVGIIPLIFQDAFWEGLSFTIVFGLLFATVLTLFLTPALYVEVETEPGVLTAFLLASLTGAVAVSQLLGGQIVPAAIIALVATLLFGLAAYLIRRGERLVVVKASPEI
jgi:HAE1 family hydrophobic/amphiphilic exporter-1